MCIVHDNSYYIASQLVLTYTVTYQTQCSNKFYKPLLTTSLQPPQQSNECYDQHNNDEDTNHNFESLPSVICIGKHGSYKIGSNLLTFSFHKNGIHRKMLFLLQLVLTSFWGVQ